MGLDLRLVAFFTKTSPFPKVIAARLALNDDHGEAQKGFAAAATGVCGRVQGNKQKENGIMRLLLHCALLATSLALSGGASAQDSPARVTILYDAIGKSAQLKHGWGYSALIEYGGRRILFDTGGRLNDFASNVKSLGVDLTRLDFVVLSHRHGDHTSGLHHVLKINPGVKIYTPAEQQNFHTPSAPGLVSLIKRHVETAPEDMHYFDRNVPPQIGSDSPWPDANFAQIRTPTEVLPGVWLFSTVSDVTGTKEMNEISMALSTPQGLVVVVGCSHPGIEKILDAAVKIEPRVYSVFGGFHLAETADAEVSSLVMRFKDKWKFERVAAGHCTGEFAFSEFNRVYGPKYDRAVVGAVIALPR
jgi:7,8-dihydropterin-6-yl-methyl-4-(beta-D-ribofuranosyl)aminobenzene 5'-phosphate synthase